MSTSQRRTLQNVAGEKDPHLAKVRGVCVGGGRGLATAISPTHSITSMILPSSSSLRPQPPLPHPGQSPQPTHHPRCFRATRLYLSLRSAGRASKRRTRSTNATSQPPKPPRPTRSTRVRPWPGLSEAPPRWPLWQQAKAHLRRALEGRTRCRVDGSRRCSPPLVVPRAGESVSPKSKF